MLIVGSVRNRLALLTLGLLNVNNGIVLSISKVKLADVLRFPSSFSEELTQYYPLARFAKEMLFVPVML